jgi:hypothetical protein
MIILVLASVCTLALAGLVNLIAQIHARRKHAANLDCVVGLHDINND